MKKGIIILPDFYNRQNILQGTTTVSLGDFNFFHGRDKKLVRKNIDNFKKKLEISNLPLVLIQQVHGSHVAVIRKKPRSAVKYFLRADALVTSIRNVMIGILTADCLPVFLYDHLHNAIGLVHAGWRGIAKGIIKETLTEMRELYHSRPEEIIAGIGPHISARHYEIDAETAAKLGLPASNNINADLSGLVKKQLISCGVPGCDITVSKICTYASKQCYSYRRQGEKAGRLLSFLLLK